MLKNIIILSFLLFSNIVLSKFSDMSCLNSDFNIEITHKGIPFGLTKNILKISKKSCLIEINHERIKFMKNRWIIDVCRGPIHIKSGTGAVDVLKKTQECNEKSDDKFCEAFRDIQSMIQDDGLIFAEGIKEDIQSDHGRSYCSFLLLQKYLGDGFIFNKTGNYTDVLHSLKKETCEVPKKIELEKVEPVGIKKEEVKAPAQENKTTGTF